MSQVPRACCAGHSDPVQHDARYPEDEAGAAVALRLVVQARDAEIQMLKLLVQKLKLQLARRNRMVFGSASERFVDPAQNPQGTLLEGAVLDGIPAKRPASPAVSSAANNPPIDRSLPGHLPREAHVHRPETTTAHHDATGQPCGCGQCG